MKKTSGMSRHKRSNRSGRIYVSLFAIGLAVLEATVVHVSGFERGGDLGAGASFIAPVGKATAHLLTAQSLYMAAAREGALLVTFIVFASVIGTSRIERWAAFLWSSGVFILCWYAVRYTIWGDPRSLFQFEALIVPPRPVMVPVYAALSVGAVFIGIGAVLYALAAGRKIGRLTL